MIHHCNLNNVFIQKKRDGNSKMEVTLTSPPNVHEEEKVLGEDASG